MNKVCLLPDCAKWRCFKSQIAFAQTYFAVQTRKQEIIEQRLLDVDRLNARTKLTRSEKKLSGVLYERGVDEKALL